MRPGSKARLSEDKDIKEDAKSNAAVAEDQTQVSTNIRSEIPRTTSRELKLDLSKVINTQPQTHKPHRNVKATPEEIERKKENEKATKSNIPDTNSNVQSSNQKEHNVKQVSKGNFQLNLETNKNQVEPVSNKELPATKKDPSTKESLSQKNISDENQAKQIGNNDINMQNETNAMKTNKGTNAKSTENDLMSLAELKKAGNSLKTTELKVSPDIFVSLKTGSIYDDYRVGQVLGEGCHQYRPLR